MNRHLKRDLLGVLANDMRLESLLETWCAHVLPDYRLEYVQANMLSARYFYGGLVTNNIHQLQSQRETFGFVCLMSKGFRHLSCQFHVQASPSMLGPNLNVGQSKPKALPLPRFQAPDYIKIACTGP
jgi:hypothetical protein